MGQAYDTPHMDMNNGSHTDAEKSQAGTNLVIVILVLVIVVAGVKLLLSSNSAVAPTAETGTEEASAEMATTTEGFMTEPVAETAEESMQAESSVTAMPKPAMPSGETGAAMVPGKGEVAFSVLTKDAVAVRAIYVHNPARASEGDAAWIQVYDGYRAVPAGQATLIFTVSLSAMQYDQVKVRTLNVSTGVPDEAVKQMPVTVSAGEKSLVTIEL